MTNGNGDKFLSRNWKWALATLGGLLAGVWVASEAWSNVVASGVTRDLRIDGIEKRVDKIEDGQAETRDLLLKILERLN